MNIAEINDDVPRNTYVIGGLQLMTALLETTFVNGIRDENVKFVVKSTIENIGLVQLCEIPISEEKELNAAKYWNISKHSSYRKDERGRQTRRPMGNATGRRERLCFKCGGDDHRQRDCPRRPGGKETPLSPNVQDSKHSPKN